MMNACGQAVSGPDSVFPLRANQEQQHQWLRNAANAVTANLPSLLDQQQLHACAVLQNTCNIPSLGAATLDTEANITIHITYH
jgi:non-ribosomal peptide synthetase component F